MRISLRRVVCVFAWLSALSVLLMCLLMLLNYGQREEMTRRFKVRTPAHPSFSIYWDAYSGLVKNLTLLDHLRNKYGGRGPDLTIGQSVGGKGQSESDLPARLQQVEKEAEQSANHHFNLNTERSDAIPLNRDVPDSRPQGCSSLQYPSHLPTASIVIPFHNEWPSVIIRTVYSLINRTPSHLLKEIILVDDASDLNVLKEQLTNYLQWYFPSRLVKLLRLPSRVGLIQARLEGFKLVTGDVVSFFDSHMEVNVHWLEPLLNEIVKNKKTLAMGQLDYIDHETFHYGYYPGYRTRYGFTWKMQFFETYFRPDQLKGKLNTDPMPGVVMVGPGFVVDVEYFKQIGTYDGGMKIWGGENIELAWRVWMCGGQLLHVPCSRIGHVERSQPYSFPEGRQLTETHNYKRAVDVWLGEYKKYVYAEYPHMEGLAVEGLSQRKLIKHRLGCQSFSWFLSNVWPELLPYKENATHWGQIQALDTTACFDTEDYVFSFAKPLTVAKCEQSLTKQGFSLQLDGQLKTTLHCVVPKIEGMDVVPVIQNCFLQRPVKWNYTMHKQLAIVEKNLCLQVLSGAKLVFLPCLAHVKAQKWVFKNQGLLPQVGTAQFATKQYPTSIMG